VSSEIESFCGFTSGATALELALFDLQACGISDTAAAKYFTGCRIGEISSLGRVAFDSDDLVLRAAMRIGSGDFADKPFESAIPAGLAIADAAATPTAHTPAVIAVSQSLATTRSPY